MHVGDEPKAGKTKKSKADKPMTNRQVKLVQGMAAGKSASQAAIDAGYSPKRANNSAWQALKTIRAGFQEAAENLGITPQTYMDKYVHPGMQATVVPRGTYMGGFFTAKEQSERLT
jgi:hypothetical protein